MGPHCERDIGCHCCKYGDAYTACGPKTFRYVSNIGAKNPNHGNYNGKRKVMDEEARAVDWAGLWPVGAVAGGSREERATVACG